MKFWRLALVTTALALSSSVNASVIKTLNGIEYEWLELTETQGLSRNQVEAQLSAATIGDALYGFEYASRALIEDLFLSYTPWDGINGVHGESSVVTALSLYINDFGATEINLGNGTDSLWDTVDGYSVSYDASVRSFGIYGAGDECGIDLTCYSSNHVYTNAAGEFTMAYMHDVYGFNQFSSTVGDIGYSESYENFGSHLVRVSAVPVPAAVWLFSSGLIGLVGFARHKRT